MLIDYIQYLRTSNSDGRIDVYECQDVSRVERRKTESAVQSRVV